MAIATREAGEQANIRTGEQKRHRHYIGEREKCVTQRIPSAIIASNHRLNCKQLQQRTDYHRYVRGGYE